MTSREAVRKFEEYETGYRSYRIIMSSVLRSIRLSVTTQWRSRSQRTRLRRIIQKSRLHEEARAAAVEHDVGIQIISRSWMRINSWRKQAKKLPGQSVH